jgi:hypothetical protein
VDPLKGTSSNGPPPAYPTEDLQGTPFKRPLPWDTQKGTSFHVPQGHALHRTYSREHNYVTHSRDLFRGDSLMGNLCSALHEGNPFHRSPSRKSPSGYTLEDTLFRGPKLSDPLQGTTGASLQGTHNRDPPVGDQALGSHSKGTQKRIFSREPTPTAPSRGPRSGELLKAPN